MPTDTSAAPMVLGLGNACMDTCLRVGAIPGPGGKAAVLSQQQRAGGQAAGAMIGCVRLGLRARFLLRRGDDANGDRLQAELAAGGLDLSAARVLPGVTTATAFILTADDGQRVVLWTTDRRLRVPAAAITPELCSGVDAVFIDGKDGPACLRLARMAQRARLPVVADLDEWYPHTTKLLPYIQHLIVPEEFIEVWAARAAPRVASTLRARLRALAAQTDGVAVATRGVAGAMAVGKDGRILESPAFVVAVVDSTGAGDAFHAAYMAAWLEGQELAQRLRFANAAGALACTVWGAQAGLPDRDAVLNLLHRNR